ncbi:MAG: PA0069 family radical SAM protein [Candidatus Hydrogenedentes bacterium]|nr:PA0069 family radical SAM protein [Candidatus Hydrogenedentota bacterium]
MGEPIRGRGVSRNLLNRFDEIDYIDDYEHADPEPRNPATQFIPDASKSIISRNDSPDVGFNASVNPYRGCEHGCCYCFARPTHEYLGMSAGLDFETKIMVKERAPELLCEELHHPKWTPQVLLLSGVTDPYQPVEKRLRITRGCLEVLRDYRNPVAIITKNRLVTRDVDLLQEMAGYGAAAVFVSVTTLNLSLNRSLEPRSSSPKQRLRAIQTLAEAGVPVGAMIAPVIPGLTDSEIPAILEAVADHGGQFAGFIVLRLPWAVAPLFERWLDEHAPEKKDKVLNRVRALRGGKLYKSEWGTRMKGEGPFAEQIRALFQVASVKHGLSGGAPALSTAAFRRPDRRGDQLSLFG